jgi:hypothetical protein
MHGTEDAAELSHNKKVWQEKGASWAIKVQASEYMWANDRSWPVNEGAEVRTRIANT